MWLQHWNLGRDPFAGPAYVATPAHAEAEERLVHAIAAGERLAVLRADAGLGKSTVLARALDRARGMGRQIGRLSSPSDGASLFAGLAAGLGVRIPPGAARAPAWRRLADAVRLCRWQGLGVVLAVDSCEHIVNPTDLLDLERLHHLDPHPDARVTVVQVGRGPGGDGASADWGLSIRLFPLSRGEAEVYLASKLSAAGRLEPTFTPRALALLHSLSLGNPRGLDRLASLALMAGALRRLEVIPPDVVEGVAQECATPQP